MDNNILKYTIDKNASIKDALVLLDKLSDDVLTLFVLADNKVVGTITDGDIRRALIRNISIDASVTDVMNKDFKYISLKENNIQKIREIKQIGIFLLPCIGENGELLKIYNLKKKKSILPIDAVLMAGGKGERLRPLTEKTPKPLLPVGNKAIIDHNIDRLINYGVEHIHVTTNYLAEQIEEHFTNERDGVKIQCVREEHYWGTVASVKLIPFIHNENILIMNSDLFTNIDFEDFFFFFKEENADMAVAAIPYSINIPYGILELNGIDVRSIKEKPTYNYYANAGIYLIKKELLDLIPSNTYFNATDCIETLIQKKYKVSRYPLTGYWIDIGKIDDYRKAQDFIKHTKTI